jgi:hypothetical protein
VFTFAFQIDKGVILRPKESFAFAFATAFGSLDNAPESSDGFARKTSPGLSGSSASPKQLFASISIGEVGKSMSLTSSFPLSEGVAQSVSSSGASKYTCCSPVQSEC